MALIAIKEVLKRTAEKETRFLGKTRFLGM